MWKNVIYKVFYFTTPDSFYVQMEIIRYRSSIAICSQNMVNSCKVSTFQVIHISEKIDSGEACNTKDVFARECIGQSCFRLLCPSQASYHCNNNEGLHLCCYRGNYYVKNRLVSLVPNFYWMWFGMVLWHATIIRSSFFPEASFFFSEKKLVYLNSKLKTFWLMKLWNVNQWDKKAYEPFWSRLYGEWCATLPLHRCIWLKLKTHVLAK